MTTLRDDDIDDISEHELEELGQEANQHEIPNPTEDNQGHDSEEESEETQEEPPQVRHSMRIRNQPSCMEPTMSGPTHHPMIEEDCDDQAGEVWECTDEEAALIMQILQAVNR